MSDDGLPARGAGDDRGLTTFENASATIVARSGKDGPQLIESRAKRWSDEAEAIFLDHLGASCNYTYSAKQADFSREAIYMRRRRDPDFARRCADAIAQGYARIEALLVEGAERALDGRGPDPDAPIPPMSVADALAVLKLHRATATGADVRRPGWRGRPRGLDEVKASILRKLSAIERARRSADGEEGDAGQA